jgi:hypothetical protein
LNSFIIFQYKIINDLFFIYLFFIFNLYNMNSYQIILLIIAVVLITLLFVYARNLVNTSNVTGSIGSFQKMTIMITLIILLVIFILIMASLVYAKKNAADNVPILPQCPDFWEIGGTEKNPTCINVQNLGTCPAASGDEHLTMDFNSGNFTDNCAKYTWANNCNVAWDGLTYGVANPCVITPEAAAAATAAANATSKTIA